MGGGLGQKGGLQVCMRSLKEDDAHMPNKKEGTRAKKAKTKRIGKREKAKQPENIHHKKNEPGPTPSSKKRIRRNEEKPIGYKTPLTATTNKGFR